MNQILLLVSVLIALFLISKQGQKVVKDVSKSVSSLTGQKGKGGFPSGLVLVLVLVALLCLSRKGLVEGTGGEETGGAIKYNWSPAGGDFDGGDCPTPATPLPLPTSKTILIRAKTIMESINKEKSKNENTKNPKWIGECHAKVAECTPKYVEYCDNPGIYPKSLNIVPSRFPTFEEWADCIQFLEGSGGYDGACNVAPPNPSLEPGATPTWMHECTKTRDTCKPYMEMGCSPYLQCASYTGELEDPRATPCTTIDPTQYNSLEDWQNCFTVPSGGKYICDKGQSDTTRGYKSILPEAITDCYREAISCEGQWDEGGGKGNCEYLNYINAWLVAGPTDPQTDQTDPTDQTGQTDQTDQKGTTTDDDQTTGDNW